MIRKTTNVGARFSRYALVVAVSATLAACGGSSGDDNDTTGGTGIDLDMDGIDDSVDDFIDLDGNGINDADEIDLGGDGGDEGDGGDDVPNNQGSDEFVNCDGAGGEDALSADDQWGNNCTVRRFVDHSTSYYTRGIQRIISCTGVPIAQIDAQYGPATEIAVETYQDNKEITINGEVDMETWTELRGELERIAEDTTLAIETWAVSGEGACAGQSQFFRNSDPVTGDVLNWRIANNPGVGVDDQVEFSVRNPFN